MTTDKKLIAAAKRLLDTGGDEAVTLRAVGHACGISHNAPYKHFKNRDALLAAVATADFILLTDAFRKARSSAEKPTTKLTRTFKILVDFSKKHPARYHLLFSTPSIAAQHGELKKAAVDAFAEVVGIVGECQSLGELPEARSVYSTPAATGPSATIALLLFATAHGLIAIEANGGLHPEKGFTGVAPGLELLVQLLSRKA
jgi:AcrR family transcriptional regulator